MPERIPLVVSGDLHAIGEGRMLRSGQLDFSRHPVIPVLPGPLGTSDGGWASEFRGVGPMPPKHLDMQETVKPIEENGFLLMDFAPETITLRYFKWNQKSRSRTRLHAFTHGTSCPSRHRRTSPKYP